MQTARMHIQPRLVDILAFLIIEVKIAVSWIASEMSSAIVSGSRRRFAEINRNQYMLSRDSLREMHNFAMKSAFVCPAAASW